jgi:signal transduction histidine kinase
LLALARTEVVVSAELELELRNLKPGDHACVLYDGAGRADDWETIVPFVKDGLARGERCQLVVDDATHRAGAMQMLSEAGVNAELEARRGALTFFEQGPRMFAPGRFDPRVLMRGMAAGVKQALREGYGGVRICGSSPYSPAGAVVDERAWVEFEALMSDEVPRWKAITICRHDLRRSQPAFLREMLRVHPKAVLGPLVCPCTYYEPPNMVLGRVSDDERLRWMLGQLCDARLAQRALERAVQARDEFLSAASHELRTPLTPMVLELEQVVRGAERLPDEHVTKSSIMPALRRLRGHVRRFVDVVQRLIDASQLREARIEFHLEPVDLTEVTRSALDHCRDALRRAHCEVSLVAPESVVGQWDRMRVEQVVANLVENAAKFGESKPIDVTVSRSDGVARLVVRDHGVGIRPEDVPRVFERFERGAPVSQYGGFGLGLWVASKIVQAFGGQISVESAPGSGTTFAVDLPLQTAKP